MIDRTALSPIAVYTCRRVIRRDFYIGFCQYKRLTLLFAFPHNQYEKFLSLSFRLKSTHLIVSASHSLLSSTDLCTVRNMHLRNIAPTCFLATNDQSKFKNYLRRS